VKTHIHNITNFPRMLVYVSSATVYIYCVPKKWLHFLQYLQQ